MVQKAVLEQHLPTIRAAYGEYDVGDHVLVVEPEGERRAAHNTLLNGAQNTAARARFDRFSSLIPFVRTCVWTAEGHPEAISAETSL